MLSTAGAGLINTPRRKVNGVINRMTGKNASDQGNEDRGDGTTED